MAKASRAVPVVKKVTLTAFPPQLWQEVRMMAVINNTSPSHVMEVAVVEYLKSHHKRSEK